MMGVIKRFLITFEFKYQKTKIYKKRGYSKEK